MDERVGERTIVQRNLARQREWYGEPLGDRVRRLVVAFDVSQAHLAEVLGLSAPMLSQLMSGRRAKIGNPAVLSKLIMLERKVLVPAVAAGSADAIAAALDDVRLASPTVGTGTLPVRGAVPEANGLKSLRDTAKAADLAAAADLLAESYPAIADVLRRASMAE